MIRAATVNDAAAIAAIYNHYIEHTAITFEEEAVAAEQMQSRIQTVQQAQLPWLVLEEQGTVLGYAYATPWRVRSAYRFSVESTVYLHKDAGGRGLGSQLYTELLAQLQQCGRRVVIGGIALPNQASVALHEKLGFEKVAHFAQVGLKFERWTDVGYWQLIFDQGAA